MLDTKKIEKLISNVMKDCDLLIEIMTLELSCMKDYRLVDQEKLVIQKLETSDLFFIHLNELKQSVSSDLFNENVLQKDLLEEITISDIIKKLNHLDYLGTLNLTPDDLRNYNLQIKKTYDQFLKLQDKLKGLKRRSLMQRHYLKQKIEHHKKSYAFWSDLHQVTHQTYEPDGKTKVLQTVSQFNLQA